MRGQDCKRTHSAQGNAGYIYEAKRREIKEIETMRGARVCRGFDFSVKGSSNNACRRFWFRDRLQTQIYYEVQTVFGHIIPKNIKLS